MVEPEPERPQPAVPIKKSVTPEYLICLEDGKKLKMLKRHLQTSYNLTPDQYRERWGLGAEYPMVAPNYAKHRSSLAKKIGLGTKPRGRPPGSGHRAGGGAGGEERSSRRGQGRGRGGVRHRATVRPPSGLPVDSAASPPATRRPL